MKITWYYIKTRFEEYHVGVIGEIIVDIKEDIKWLKGKNLNYFKKYWEIRNLLEKLERME